jgi:ABC-type transporter Mla subunit MlaD
LSIVDEWPVVRWSRVLAIEVSRAPGTLRRARLMLEELARLPAQLDALIASLDRTNDSIDRSLGELSSLITELHTNLSSFTAGTSARMDHLDNVVSELTGALTAIIGAIPGARRALGRSTPPS